MKMIFSEILLGHCQGRNKILKIIWRCEEVDHGLFRYNIISAGFSGVFKRTEGPNLVDATPFCVSGIISFIFHFIPIGINKTNFLLLKRRSRVRRKNNGGPGKVWT